MRQKELLSISFNEASRTVFLYTKRKVTGKDLKSLPVSIMQCGIAYPQGTVEEIGKGLPIAHGAASFMINVRGSNLYACGSSISPGNSATAGTLGALVVDRQGTMHGLSNNHVTGLCNHSPVGIPILAPGVLDVCAGGIIPFTIGFHKAVLEMNVGTQGNIDVTRNSDAAIFQIMNPQSVTSSQGGVFDTPTSVLDPQDDMRVEKVGRTTGHTHGKIMGRELIPMGISYSAPNFGFSGTILFEDVWIIHGDTVPFAQPGDSGSLITHTDGNGDRHAVGLLFAGGTDSLGPEGQRTFFLPIRPILEKLGVNLLGGHNV
ncbi:S1 family peptidase [Pseudomonas sp. PDM33]|uniref:S1 family peptidase n=1 Tax=Pseudomonas sp. PDM33 TaxID=2854765 RepID=UPI001C4665F2|nr:S1 family peptidase [Pseudomonas sp. PDM33]